MLLWHNEFKRTRFTDYCPLDITLNGFLQTSNQRAKLQGPLMVSGTIIITTARMNLIAFIWTQCWKTKYELLRTPDVCLQFYSRAQNFTDHQKLIFRLLKFDFRPSSFGWIICFGISLWQGFESTPFNWINLFAVRWIRRLQRPLSPEKDRQVSV